MGISPMGSNLAMSRTSRPKCAGFPSSEAVACNVFHGATGKQTFMSVTMPASQGLIPDWHN